MVGGLDWWNPEHGQRLCKMQLLLSSNCLKKCSHRYLFSFDFKVPKNIFKSKTGIAFHRDGIR